jgi:hypothetical protein
MIVGEPSGFTSAMLLPATSPFTFANFAACSRQTFAGAASNPEGAGRIEKLVEKFQRITIEHLESSGARGM